ncbi:MAG: UDP-N-acetylenolpyruvoylglucosamine reductase, partial [Lachnospiraceae bacterium]|nr:UDP-N-acetylenolpyruvoylglucosamine reductase [Lachnospiraceae bacterium]
EFGYRTSAIKHQPFTVAEVEIELQSGDRADIKARMEELAAKRREKQPLEYPSAGSTFKRPEGYFAGELIMKAGLRGYQIGGAQVSEKHCGFVINRGDATAEDVKQLIAHVQETVKHQFGVALEPEVIILG